MSVNTGYAAAPFTAFPTIPAKNAAFTDPTFGSRILRVTDATDGTTCAHAYATWPAMNRDSTRILIKCDGIFKFFTINPTTFQVTSSRTCTASFGGELAAWDMSGSANNEMFVLNGGATEADRKLYKLDVDTDVMTAVTGGDYHLKVRHATGTVTSVTSNAIFFDTAVAALSPITDMEAVVTGSNGSTYRMYAGVELSRQDGVYSGSTIKPITGANWADYFELGGSGPIAWNDNYLMMQHFYAGQILGFATGSNAGSEKLITRFDASTGKLTMTSAFASTVNIGDQFYIRGAGVDTGPEVSDNGRYIAIRHGERQGVNANSFSHVVLVFDTTTQTWYRRYFTKQQADFALDDLLMSHTTASLNVFGAVNSPSDVSGAGRIWTFADGASGTLGDGTLTAAWTPTGHADSCRDDIIVANNNDAMSIYKRPYSDSSNPVVCFAEPDTGGKRPYTSAMHIGCTSNASISAKAIIENYYIIPSTPVVHSAPIYVVNNFTSGASYLLPPTQANYGTVFHNGAFLTAMGDYSTQAAAVAAITASGQWAYDSVNDDIYIRGTADADLTAAGQVIQIMDWRPYWGEIYRIDYSNPAVTNNSYRICHHWSMTVNGGYPQQAHDYDSQPHSSPSWDGRLVVFKSNWGGSSRIDTFIAEIPAQRYLPIRWP